MAKSLMTEFGRFGRGAGLVASLGLVACLAASAAWAADPGATTQVKGGTGLFQPESANLPSWSDASGQARIVRRAGGLALSVERAGAAALMVELPDVLVQATAVHRHGERLLVTGWMNGALAGAVVVVDANDGRIVDHFWGYGVSVSPDASAIAFVRFHPSYFVTGTDSQVRLYRSADTPQANRREVPATWAGAGLAWQERDVGAAVYPLAAAERWRLNVEVPEASAHQRLSPLAWSPDGRRLAFLDGQGGKVRLVVAELPQDRTLPVRTSVHELERPGPLCLAGSGVSGCPQAPAEAVSFVWGEQSIDIVVGNGTVTGSSQVRRVPLTALQLVAR